MSIIKELKNIAKDLVVMYVEDDPELAEKTSILLNNFFKTSLIAYDGNEGLNIYNDYHAKHNRYIDIVISDIKMPGKNGVELAKDILRINEDQNLVIVSAYDDSRYLIELINTGVDHFLSKPFKSDMLIEALYKSCQKVKKIGSSEFISLNDGFVWNKKDKMLKDQNDFVKITKNERTILDLFINNPNQIFSDDMIFNAMYYDDANKDMSVDSVKSIIKRLRKKLPADSIENIYGDGYRIKLPKQY